MMDRLVDGVAALIIRYHSGSRIVFYEGLRNLVENGISPSDALQELHQIWSENGKKPTEALAIFTRDLIIQLIDGRPLSKALADWVPYEEASMLAAGERGATGLAQACEDVVQVIEKNQQIAGAVSKAVAYPSFLMLQIGLLLWLISSKLIPSMAQVSNPDSWTGSGYWLYAVSGFVSGYGVISVCILLIVIVLFLVSLPRWTGAARRVADRLPFYATYRMVHGSTFLVNMAVLMRASIPPNEALSILGEYASPWLKERIAAARHGLNVGSNLGVALDNAGHDFPDKKAIQFIRILASRTGFPEALNRYSNRWLTNSIKRLQQLSQITFVIAMLLNAALMALVVDGTQEMQSSFESSATHRVSQ